MFFQAIKSLFGFERIHVPAGATVEVILYPEFTDLTHVGADGVRTANTGTYTVSFGIQDTADQGMGFAKHVFSAEL